MVVFLLLGLFAWWIFQSVSLPPLIRNLIEEDQAIATAALPATEEEKWQQELLRLPAPPQEHTATMTEFLARLGELKKIPTPLTNAVQRDRDTPTDQNPPAWNDQELSALQDYQTKFHEAWELFLSGSSPDWEKYPASAIFFRSQFPAIAPAYQDQFRYGFYQPGQPESWNNELEDHPVFYLRFFQKLTTLGSLRFGSLSGWAATDTVFLTKLCETTIRNSGYFFSDPSLDPREMLSWVPPPPTVATLRAGLKTDRAVFLASAKYLGSLPPETSARAGLTRLLGDQGDADWFISHVDHPRTAQKLAAILQQGADQILSLEQKTYLPKPAWHQWLAGDLHSGLSPVLRGALKGMGDFEKIAMTYRVSLAFLQASANYRQTGLEGVQKIPDPFQPGTVLSVATSTNEITLSSAFVSDDGRNFSYTFKTKTSP